jgi:hypothetical protein
MEFLLAVAYIGMHEHEHQKADRGRNIDRHPGGDISVHALLASARPQWSL